MRNMLRIAALLAALMMLMLNVFALADDDDWAALFTDNTWADAAGNSDSTSQSDLDDANAFWAAVTADQNQSSSSTSSGELAFEWPSETTSTSSSSTGSSGSHTTSVSTANRVGELGDHSVEPMVLALAALLCLGTAALAHTRRTAER